MARYNDPPGKVIHDGKVEGQKLYDENGNLAIDVGGRKLYGPNGSTVTADWSSALGGEGGVVDGQQLFDDNHLLSLDAGERKLYASDGTTEQIKWTIPNEVDFLGGFTYFTTDGTYSSLAVDNIAGANGSSSLNIDLLNRKLYASDGTTEMMNWSQSSNGVTFGPDGSWMNPTSEGLLVNAILNYSGDALANIDLLHRQLFHPDGATSAMNYGTTGTVEIGQHNGKITLVDAPTGGSSGGDFSQITIGGAGQGIDLSYDAATGSLLDISSTKIKIHNLPTSDPHVANQLWRSTNDVKISTG